MYPTHSRKSPNSKKSSRKNANRLLDVDYHGTPALATVDSNHGFFEFVLPLMFEDFGMPVPAVWKQLNSKRYPYTDEGDMERVAELMGTCAALCKLPGCPQPIKALLTHIQMDVGEMAHDVYDAATAQLLEQKAAQYAAAAHSARDNRGRRRPAPQKRVSAKQMIERVRANRAEAPLSIEEMLTHVRNNGEFDF